MQEKETHSIDELKKMSCCASDKNLQSCCPQTEDDSCASETTDIQFDFETFTSSYLLNVEERSTLVYTCLLFETLYILEHHFASLKEVPLPPNINKPKLFDAIDAEALKGVLATRDLIPTKGRAAGLGERAVGHIDPGAKSCQLIINAVCRVLKDIEDKK